MNFVTTVFNLAERVFDAFVSLGAFLTDGGFLMRINETLVNSQVWIEQPAFIANVINWLLSSLNPAVMQMSFAELLLITGIPIILILNLFVWLLKLIPVL